MKSIGGSLRRQKKAKWGGGVDFGIFKSFKMHIEQLNASLTVKTVKLSPILQENKLRYRG